MSYKVREVAELTGVSVRTLHHYDEIGLLRPDSLTESGYRIYTDENLERLQQILFFKELDFSLQEIKEILDSPGFDRKKALSSHLKLLEQKKTRLERIMDTVVKTINAIEGGNEMSKKDMFGAFEFNDSYAQEAKEKYGHTDAWKESQARTSRYTGQDWAEIMAKGDAIYKKLAAIMDRSPDDPAVQDAVGEIRQHITDSFYTCTVDIFRGLGELFVADGRFTANIDKYGEGLAVFLRDAIKVYCDRQEGMA